MTCLPFSTRNIDETLIPVEETYIVLKSVLEKAAVKVPDEPFSISQYTYPFSVGVKGNVILSSSILKLLFIVVISPNLLSPISCNTRTIF